jgi:hypothetical protein
MNQATLDPSDIDAPSIRDKKQEIDPNFLRNIKVIGAVVAVALVAVVVVVFSLRSQSENLAAVNVTAAQSGPAQANNAQQTPAMQDMLKERQAMEANSAAEQGKTYIPKEAIGTVEPVAVPTQEVGPGPSAIQATAIPLQNDPVDIQRREGLKRQLGVLFPTSVTTSGGSRQSIEPLKQEEVAASSGSSGARQSVAGSAGASTNEAAKPVLITALEIHAGEMANPINVGQGKTAFASARITAGKFEGAYLIGTSTLDDEEAIDTRFTSMRFGNKSYKIDAIVLDEQTAAAGLRGEIDRRILQRYVLPMTLGVLEGYVSAKAQTGNTLVIGAGGTTQQSSPAPTETQAVNAGLAVGLKQAQTDIQKEAAKPIRGATPRGAPMGILFRADVVEGGLQ